jgi:hypothetical protein
LMRMSSSFRPGTLGSSLMGSFEVRFMPRFVDHGPTLLHQKQRRAAFWALRLVVVVALSNICSPSCSHIPDQTSTAPWPSGPGQGQLSTREYSWRGENVSLTPDAPSWVGAARPVLPARSDGCAARPPPGPARADRSPLGGARRPLARGALSLVLRMTGPSCGTLPFPSFAGFRPHHGTPNSSATASAHISAKATNAAVASWRSPSLRASTT